ncbi:hypothetical protein B0A54_10540 [Friedmanniomyces endolithicus]|uniref:Uncharacterized protein n=1 Tax=Friedmanniomyces endolithicus TaxID=329885 RepID=A0A4U0UPR9_9PEZI|nr:hypothetical protein B0A54_10540 [Friedmanniomyces endolithicus]
MVPASQSLPAPKPQDPRLRPQSRAATASPKPMIDPATIITWQEGLRCLTKIAAQNAQFAVTIRGSEKDAELADFDRKIYAAQVSMEAAMSGQLKGLGVPFFGTQAGMVVLDEEQSSIAAPSVSGPTITVSELLALRRKIVGHLEDLYRD